MKAYWSYTSPKSNMGSDRFGAWTSILSLPRRSLTTHFPQPEPFGFSVLICRQFLTVWSGRPCGKHSCRMVLPNLWLKLWTKKCFLGKTNGSNLGAPFVNDMFLTAGGVLQGCAQPPVTTGLFTNRIGLYWTKLDVVLRKIVAQRCWPAWRSTYCTSLLLASHVGNSATFCENWYGAWARSSVPVRRNYGAYPRIVPVPYPYRTRTVAVPKTRTYTP